MSEFDFDSSPLKGACFCGEVTFTVVPPAIIRAFCHCSNCQRLTGCAFVHTVHFPKSAFQWTHARESEDPLTKLDVFQFTVPGKSTKKRYRCKSCGVCIAAYNSDKDKWSVWGTLFPRTGDKLLQDDVWELIKPEAHIFYGTRLIDINDDIGKWEGYKGLSERLS